MKTKASLFVKSLWDRCALLTTVLCYGVGMVSAETLLYNGSFEGGSAATPYVFPTNTTSTVIDGWRANVGGISGAWLDDANAQEGSRYVRLGSDGGASPSPASSISTNGAGFVAGTDYLLSFWAAGGVGTMNTISVLLDGLQLARIALPNYTQNQFDTLNGIEWVEYLVPFTPQSDVLTLGFRSPTLSSSSETNVSTIYIDNVSVSAVPEPGGAMLLLTLAGVTLSFQRRRPSLPHGPSEAAAAATVS